ncbi:sphingomyelin phosphodiesterase [Staphylococcus sp. HKU1]
MLIITLLTSVSIFSYHKADAAKYPDDFKITTHNVYFMPQAIYPNWGQMQRANLIPKANYIQNQDVIIFNELFDKQATTQFLNNLSSQYPYQTPIVGKNKEGWNRTSGSYNPAKVVNGGVNIVSKWPILEKEQHIYKNGCGADGFSNKGFAYIKINKNGKPYHIIGTHLQAEDGSCIKGKDRTIRESQMHEIRQFIKDKQIPKDEAVFIGGDLNVIKGSDEYSQMFDHLNVTQPTSFSGHNYSWDTQTNGIAHYNYPKLAPQHLDYILPDKDHAQPSSWDNKVHKAKSPQWSVTSWGKDYQYNDYSDHYPLAASTGT